MAYTTIALVRVSTGMSDVTTVPDATITGKITFADGVINGKIGEVYSLPLASTPDIIGFLSLEIASGMLFLDQYGEETKDGDKGWEKRIKMAMDTLEMIRMKTLKLYNASSNYDEFDTSDLRSPSFYPTEASSQADAVPTTVPTLTMKQVF